MIPLPAFIVLALILISLGFESARLRRNIAACEREGHLWASAGPGDHPDASYVCTRCPAEARHR